MIQNEGIPGAWEYDEKGRKFRRLGNSIIEYAPTIKTTGGEFYQDEAEEHGKRMKKEAEARRKAEEKRLFETQTNKICPFKKGKNSYSSMCEKTCPFYDKTACLFANPGKKPSSDSNGKFCPIAGKCANNCALYFNGCTMIDNLKCLKHGKEV